MPDFRVLLHRSDCTHLPDPDGSNTLPIPEEYMASRAWKTCCDCGVLYDEAYCPRCEEVEGC